MKKLDPVTKRLEAKLGFRLEHYDGPVEVAWKDGKPQPPRQAQGEVLLRRRAPHESRMADPAEIMLWELLRRSEGAW